MGRLFTYGGELEYVQVKQNRLHFLTLTQTGNLNQPADPFTYTRAKSDPDALENNPVLVADRFDYNEEAIIITSDPVITGVPATGLKVTVKGYNYHILTGATLDDPSMWEGGPRPGLPSSITLLCDTQLAGTYVITIMDATPDKDYPINEGPTAQAPRQALTFTLRVTTEAEIADQGILAQPDRVLLTAGVLHLRIDTGDENEHISSDFTVTGGTNLRIRYKIIRGSGTLYAAETQDRRYLQGP